MPGTGAAELTRERAGRECWGPGVSLGRHRHREAYAAVVLAGGYEECGSRGRFRVGPGDVLLHGPFEAHLDRFAGRGAQIVNLRLAQRGVPAALASLADPDAIIRLAERDPAEAGARVLAQLQPRTALAAPDWSDQLAADLLGDPDRRLGDWARRHGLAPETLSRGFARVFGVTPAAFRLEARAHAALALLGGGALSLADAAAQAGFADQAHMSRAVAALTGAPPGRWRGSNPFKTAAHAAR